MNEASFVDYTLMRLHVVSRAPDVFVCRQIKFGRISAAYSDDVVSDRPGSLSASIMRNGVSTAEARFDAWSALETVLVFKRSFISDAHMKYRPRHYCIANKKKEPSEIRTGEIHIYRK